MKFIVGIIVGWILAVAYYDGVVANDYKEKVKNASMMLKKADEVLLQKEEEILLLRTYIERLHEKHKIRPAFAENVSLARR
jgi:hypothetical protein